VPFILFENLKIVILYDYVVAQYVHKVVTTICSIA